MPSLSRVQDVVAPPHHLACLDGSRECLHLHGHLGVGVTGATREEHEWALVSAPGLELDHPVLADILIHRVVVHVLSLGVVDACNFRTVDLLVPRVGVDVRGAAGAHVVFVALVKTDTVHIGLDMQVTSIRDDTHTLDGAIKQLLGVGGSAGGDCPDVTVELSSHCFQGLLSDAL